MALEKCKDCGGQISKSAKACPHCGKPIRRTSRSMKLFLLLVALCVFGMYFFDSGSPTRTTAPVAQVAKTPEELRKDRIGGGFSAWDGSHRALEAVIKKGMHDPKSYEHVETTYSDKGDYLIVLTKFRGKNAFGGVILNAVKAKCSLDGQVLEILEN